MHIMRSLRSSLATAAAVGALAFTSASLADRHGKDGAMEKDIVDTAVAAGDFKTLAAALQAAGLVETLKGPAFREGADAAARRPWGRVSGTRRGY